MYNNYSIISVVQGVNGDASVTVSITGDSNETPQSLTMSTNDPSNIDQQVQDTINNLNTNASRVATLNTFLANPPIGQNLTPVPVATTPQQQYQSDLQSLQELIVSKQAMGIDITTDTDVVNMQALVQSEFDPTYIIPAQALNNATNLAANKSKIN